MGTVCIVKQECADYDEAEKKRFLFSNLTQGAEVKETRK